MLSGYTGAGSPSLNMSILPFFQVLILFIYTTVEQTQVIQANPNA